MQFLETSSHNQDNTSNCPIRKKCIDFNHVVQYAKHIERNLSRNPSIRHSLTHLMYTLTSTTQSLTTQEIKRIVKTQTFHT